MFYFQSHTTKVIDSNRAICFEDDTSTSQGPKEIVFKEHLVYILVPITSTPMTSPTIDQHLVAAPGY